MSYTEKEVAGMIQKIADVQNLQNGKVQTRFDAYDSEISELKGQTDAIEHAVALSLAPPGGDGPIPENSGVVGGAAFALRGPQDAKNHKALFGGGVENQWKDKNSTFFQALFSGRHHPGLNPMAMTEGIPSDGGFLVPSELVQQIHAVSLENEIIAPRAYVQPMKSNECKFPAMAIGNHSANLYGGFSASYTGETGTISEANPKTRQIVLNAKKLTGLLRFSSELLEDMVGGENRLIEICGRGLAWYRDRAFLKGAGAGAPLGVLNAPCTIDVPSEPDQVAGSILYENLTKMLARLHPACWKNAVWVCHVSVIPQLLQLSMPVGTAGSHIPVLTGAAGPDGQFRILTLPVIFTEKMQTLGSRGDILLADFSQYVVGLRGEMRFDRSIHTHFETDEIQARLIERHDGLPLWDTPLTLEDGSTTVSPFITLAERN